MVLLLCCSWSVARTRPRLKSSTIWHPRRRTTPAWENTSAPWRWCLVFLILVSITSTSWLALGVPELMPFFKLCRNIYIYICIFRFQLGQVLKCCTAESMLATVLLVHEACMMKYTTCLVMWLHTVKPRMQQPGAHSWVILLLIGLHCPSIGHLSQLLVSDSETTFRETFGSPPIYLYSIIQLHASSQALCSYSDSALSSAPLHTSHSQSRLLFSVVPWWWNKSTK